MARSMREKMHKADNESDSVVHPVRRGGVHEIMNKSVDDGNVLHRVEREASLVPRKSSNVKRDREDSKAVKKSAEGDDDLNEVERDDGPSTKRALSRVKLDRRASMVAPLAVNVSQVTLRFVSFLSTFP